MKAPEFLELISAVNQLDHQQRSLLATTLTQLSDEPKVSELIETAFDIKGICPHCSNAESYRHGSASGLQRYRCKACKKTFNALTKTPLAHLRYKSKWLEYLYSITALHGITEADETYLLESYKGSRKLERKPRKRGGSASKRGISNEQVCILIARDRSKQTVGFVTGHGAITKRH